jgi:hypothetical protein
MHKFAKRIQTRCAELSQGLDREYGLLAMPVILVVTIWAIPFMFIELVTWTAPEPPACDHRIDNKRAGYRRDPWCSRCSEPLCTAKNEYGGVCLRTRGHPGLHRNPYLREHSEWRGTGSTLLEGSE